MTTQDAGSGHTIQDLGESMAVTRIFPAAPDESGEPNPKVCSFKWSGFTCTRMPHDDENHVAHTALAVAIWHGGTRP